MIPVSDAYKELVKSNIRPKCEPIIKVSGIDNTGKEINLIWNASNIKDLKYKRGIDPVGRELPYMELTWTEIYTGKLNAESYPEKYNNIAKYMTVELSFVQNLGFYNTWKIFSNGRITWKSLADNNTTWKQLKRQVSQEIITVPKLFLTAKPTINGQTITWVARDFLYFLTERQIKSFATDIPFANPLRYFLINERGNFKNSLDLFKAIQDTNINIKNFQENNGYTMDKKIIFDGQTKDLLLKYASIRNFYFDFYGNSAYLNRLTENYLENFAVNSKIMFEYPKIENGTNISNYTFKSYAENKKNEETYIKSYTQQYKLKDVNVYRFDFDEYGETLDKSIQSEINYAYSEYNNDVEVVPIVWSKQDNLITQNIAGETFNEDNFCNPYTDKEVVSNERFEFLKTYFNESSSVLEFSCLPNLAIETGDILSVETNLFDEAGKKIFKNGVVICFELRYNGSMKEKFIVHERNETQ